MKLDSFKGLRKNICLLPFSRYIGDTYPIFCDAILNVGVAEVYKLAHFVPCGR